MQLFQPDLYKPQYFNAAFLRGAQKKSDGRSGYWRLFYYNMQAEALRGKPKAISKPVGRVAGASYATKKPKRATAPEPVVSLPEPVVSLPEEPPFRLAPLYAIPDLVTPIWLAMHKVITDIRFTLPAKCDIVGIPQVRGEAPSYYEETLLLLLAA